MRHAAHWALRSFLLLALARARQERIDLVRGHAGVGQHRSQCIFVGCRRWRRRSLYLVDNVLECNEDVGRCIGIVWLEVNEFQLQRVGLADETDHVDHIP